MVLLIPSFDGVLGAALRTTILQIGVPGEAIFLGMTILLEVAQEAAIIWLPEPSGESDGSNILPNQAQSRLGPVVIRFSTSDTYPTKNRKNAKNANHEGGASFVFDPTNRPSSLLKRPFLALLRGVPIDLRGPK